MIENTRTYGGNGRHAIPGSGIRVVGSPDDVRKVLRRAWPVPIEFDTLTIDPFYIGRHRREYGTTDYSVDAIAHRVMRWPSGVLIIEAQR